jgi:hypothetical protein
MKCNDLDAFPDDAASSVKPSRPLRGSTEPILAQNGPLETDTDSYILNYQGKLGPCRYQRKGPIESVAEPQADVLVKHQLCPQATCTFYKVLLNLESNRNFQSIKLITIQ